MRLKKTERKAYHVDPERTARPWNVESELLMHFRLYVLDMCGWNQVHAASFLGLSVRAMRSAVKVYRALGVNIPSMHRPHQITPERIEHIRRWVEFERVHFDADPRPFVERFAEWRQAQKAHKSANRRKS